MYTLELCAKKKRIKNNSATSHNSHRTESRFTLKSMDALLNLKWGPHNIVFTSYHQTCRISAHR